MGLRRWAWVWLVAACLAVFGMRGALAQAPLPVPALTARVIDQTGSLTPDQRQALEAKLAAIEQRHGAQFVVLLVPTVKPEAIEAYTQRVGEAWKIGRRHVGDGLLIVVAKGDRTMRIAPAKTLEGAIPDLLAHRVIEETLAPAFRKGDFAGGLHAAVDQLAARVGQEGLPVPEPRTSPTASPGFDLEDGALMLLVGVPLVGGLATSVFGRKFGTLATGGAIGALGWWLTASALMAGVIGVLAVVLVAFMRGGSSSRGFGRHSRRGGFGAGPVIWGGSGGFGGGGGGGGGGFGGFSSGGGGDFGGGGASGGW